MLLKRMRGKPDIVNLQDATGRIQLQGKIDFVVEATCNQFAHWNLSDILNAEGTLFVTSASEVKIKLTTAPADRVAAPLLSTTTAWRTRR